jgi:hypothetical protein
MVAAAGEDILLYARLKTFAVLQSERPRSRYDKLTRADYLVYSLHAVLP